MEASEVPNVENRNTAEAPRNTLSVSDWSPKLDGSSREASKQKKQQANCRASSTDISTESDSEKDAAEAYSGSRSGLMGSRRQDVTPRKRAASPQCCMEKTSKAQRLDKGSLNEATAAESEAVAVLEHFKNAAEGKQTGRSMIASIPKTEFAGDKVQQQQHHQQQMQLPLSAIHNLAQLINLQHSQTEADMSSIHPSPFQSRPNSPSLADAKANPSLGMRSCLSESSAHGLGALSKQDGTALALLQSISASSQHFKDQGARPPGLTAGHNQLLSNALQSLDKAAGGIPPTFPTYSSSTATDIAFDVSAFLNQSNKLGLAQMEKEALEIEPGSPKVNSVLGAFGSVIPGHDRAALSVEAAKASGKNGGMTKKDTAGAASKQPKGFSSVKSLARDGRTPSQLPPQKPASTAAGSPDPQILEWIVGNRASLTNRGKGGSLESTGAKASALELRGFPRQDSQSGKPLEREASSTPTLRRPIALRPRDIKDPTINLASVPSDSTLEALLARMHSAVSAQIATAGGTSSPQPAGAGTHQQAHIPAAVAANDLSRVMQWAGTELLLRDQKVREVQRQRAEEQQAHDATLSAVAADVSRLKFGQAQLVKAHRQYHDALTQKDKTLEEKDLLIASLTRTLSELKQQLQAALTASPTSEPATARGQEGKQGQVAEGQTATEPLQKALETAAESVRHAMEAQIDGKAPRSLSPIAEGKSS